MKATAGNGETCVLARSFEQSKLEFFGPCEGNGIPLGETGVAIVIGNAGGGFQHPVEAQIRQTVCRDVLADFLCRMTRCNQFFLCRRIDTVETRGNDRRRADPDMPSSVILGSRPKISRILLYSSSVRLCCANSSLMSTMFVFISPYTSQRQRFFLKISTCARFVATKARWIALPRAKLFGNGLRC